MTNGTSHDSANFFALIYRFSSFYAFQLSDERSVQFESEQEKQHQSFYLITNQIKMSILYCVLIRINDELFDLFY